MTVQSKAVAAARADEKSEVEGRVVPFAEAFRFRGKLGFISFGGPAGQVAIMHRELVERRRWVGEERFLHALNYCMLLPGPEAQQLAIYIGWLMHRTWGGIVERWEGVPPVSEDYAKARDEIVGRIRRLPDGLETGNQKE